MPRLTEGKEVAEGHRHDLEAPLLKGLDGRRLVRLHHHAVLCGITLRNRRVSIGGGNAYELQWGIVTGLRSDKRGM